MNDAQKRFCDEYLIDLNATRAYRTAYPGCQKDETANTNSSRLLRNAKVQEYIQERQIELQNETNITQKRIIEELANIAFFNIKDVYNANGTLKSINELDEKTARAISSIKSLQKVTNVQDQTVEIKSYDKKGALELLGKHLGMFKEKVEFGQGKPFEVNIRIRK